MANYTNIIPFIRKWEGGLSKNTSDTASANPVPDGSGFHTNKGITWTTWQSVNGSSKDSIDRFYKMSDNDWKIIYKKLFWDAIGGDKIKSQRIADILVNWAWGSGVYRPSVTIQRILGVTADGVIGKKTIEAINNANEVELYNSLKDANIKFFKDLGAQPKYADFLQGWLNRLDDLYTNLTKEIKEKKNSIGIGILLVVLAVVIYLIVTKQKK